jgi:hypothetical protein
MSCFSIGTDLNSLLGFQSAYVPAQPMCWLLHLNPCGIRFHQNKTCLWQFLADA